MARYEGNGQASSEEAAACATALVADREAMGIRGSELGAAADQG